MPAFAGMTEAIGHPFMWRCTKEVLGYAVADPTYVFLFATKVADAPGYEREN